MLWWQEVTAALQSKKYNEKTTFGRVLTSGNAVVEGRNY